MVLWLDLNGLSELLTVVRQYVQVIELCRQFTNIASSKFFAATAALPSAFSLSAMITFLCLV